MDCLFILLPPVKTGSSEAQKLLILMMSSFSFFFFSDCAFDVMSKKSLSSPSSQRFTPTYSKKFGSLLLNIGDLNPF